MMDDERLTVTKREQLLADSESYKEAIRDGVIEIKSSAEKWVRTVLIIGGTLILAYSFARNLIEQKRYKDNPDLPVRASASSDLGIFNRVMEQIAFFLMAMAREKLMEFLKTYQKPDADPGITEEE